MEAKMLFDLLKECGVQGLIVRNSNIMGCCVFHEERNASWGISIEPPHSHGCFSCGAKGGLYSLLVHLGFTDKKARSLAEMGDGTFNLPSLERAGERKMKVIDHTELYPFTFTKRSRAYLESRGVDADFCKELGCVLDKKQNRLLFPWWYEDRLVGVTGRSLDPLEEVKTLPYFGTRKSQCLFLPNRAVEEGIFYLVEGEIDALKVYCAGFYNTGALSFGAFTDAQSRLLLDAGVTDVVAFTDDDKTGRGLTLKVKEQLGARIHVHRVDYAPFRSLYDEKLDPGALRTRHIRRILGSLKKNCDWPTF